LPDAGDEKAQQACNKWITHRYQSTSVRCYTRTPAGLFIKQ
jgi:hypothetical protein